MENRWGNALIKTLIVVVILHVIMLIAGWLWGTELGWFGIPMIWAHWHSWGDILLSVVVLVGLYFGIYFLGTDKGDDYLDVR